VLSLQVARRRRPAPARLPAGLDVDEFLRLARMSFIRLQAAWDAADLALLERLTVGPVRAELRDRLNDRGAGPNRTEVLDLRARLLAFEALNDGFVAGIEFSGVVRERPDDDAAEFSELWWLAKVGSDPGQSWQLAQVQSLA
jgi:predicted lipid-binding transport protein (Tim44 family)